MCTFVIENGGPPGVLYELLVACFYYSFIAASIAEVSCCSFIPQAHFSGLDFHILILRRRHVIHHICHSKLSDIWMLTLPSFFTAHLIHSLSRRSISLGLGDPRSKIWPQHWLLHRLPQLLRMDFRSRLDRLHSRQCRRTNVRRLPPRPYHPTVARIRCICAHYMAVRRHCYLCESPAANTE